jgi:hypothetical protein
VWRFSRLSNAERPDVVPDGAYNACCHTLRPVELLIAVNPDPDSRLPYLMRLPLAGGMVFRTSGRWPRTTALYCYPVPIQEWPAGPEIVERVRLRSCVRRGAAIDLVLDRGRENRSQPVFTTARGRDALFWQSPRTRKQARPNVRTPTARAPGSPACRSWPTATSSTPTGSPRSRPPCSGGRCRAVSMESCTAGGWSPRWSASPSGRPGG